MEHFVVSARKYRPETFEDVVGQKAITNTLLNAINNDHLAQALLFTGPRGVGKTSCARILAKKINQDATDDETTDFAFNIFELDAASNNSVDDIRNLTDQVRIPPQSGKYKVYIIDEVHMLSQQAFNAFLKTLEEPPKHAIFILATTEKHKIIPTILSRCQIFDFKRITVGDIKEHLADIAKKEGVDADDDALHIIAQKADGAMRDALSTYDRVISFSGNKLTREAVTENLNVLDYETFFRTTDLLLDNNIPEVLIYFNEILAKGFDGQHFIAGLASHFRDLMVSKNQQTIALLEVGERTKSKYFEQSQATSYSFLQDGIDLANSCDFNYKMSQNQRLHVELCLMKLASLTDPNSPEKKKTKHHILSPKELEKVPKTVSEVAQNQETETTPVIKTSDEPKVNTDEDISNVSTPLDANINSTESPSSPPENNKPAKANSEEKNSVEEPRKPLKPSLENRPKKVNGLSIKSIQEKKRLKEAMQKDKPEEEKLTAEFSEERMLEVWDEYIGVLGDNGSKILASVMNTSRPKLDGTVIKLELPNDSMKLNILQEQGELMKFLKQKLQNTSIVLDITVNHKAEKKYVYTPREKFEKLKEVNPNLELLRTTFDLDI
ncbi:DNA polymerase III subunit gamma/tau [Psychroflexus montanilacus]|uniref:DNA polymerase III subunit gamma/tau n=1 Tax=Psychroflexus montanilacus TaxID=2873598 RepID=UPI001CCC3B6F|nr:DNA polymerase III subunit gamma/tau [Psychroflexus montanilacus]MBZ9650639.1 DNA polymerase III subunit gamma/tau [Psychroflexus montanilacus]